MLTLHSNLKLCFDDLNIAFAEMLQDRQKELQKITQDIVDNFDFEQALKAHIEKKIEEGLEKAFSEVDFSDHVKAEMWDYIEKNMKGGE